MILVDGAPLDVVPADDRGLLYGDGLFETIRFDRGLAALWPRHMGRLARDADRLGLAMPDPTLLVEEARRVLPGEAGVVRITVTRGSGARGYAAPDGMAGRRIVAGHPLPKVHGGPLRVILCESRLAAGGPLAGMKHLGRLEQVLGAREVLEAGAEEGIMLDPAGRPVCATSANLLIRLHGRWVTPAVEGAGVAGVFRDWLLEHATVAVEDVTREQLDAASAAVLINAVRGPRSVASMDGRALDVAAADAFAAEAGVPWSAG